MSDDDPLAYVASELRRLAAIDRAAADFAAAERAFMRVEGPHPAYFNALKELRRALGIPDAW